MIRSGSTLAFNIVRETFPLKKVVKVHNCGATCKRLPIVATYRHPMDCVASSIMRRGHDKPTDELLEEHIRQVKENGLLDILDLIGHKEAVLLRYEDFTVDLNVVFDALETQFNAVVSAAKRDELAVKYKIENVEKKIAELSSFSEMDKKTQLHGKHVSQYKGATGYYKEFFTKPQIARMEEAFKEFMELMGYST